jgi:hypothetical protein
MPKTVADPVRLSFMKPNCFYCYEPMKGTQHIELHFGIHFCNKHSLEAERDCNAYMHRNGVVPMDRIHAFPLLQQFVDILENTPFTLKTSDGNYVGGWCVDFGYPSRETYLRYNKPTSEWTIVLYKEVNRDYSRVVPIREFLEPIVINPFLLKTPEICEIVNAVDVLLRNGVFKAYHDSQRNNM